jgi:hypothetical protein
MHVCLRVYVCTCVRAHPMCKFGRNVDHMRAYICIYVYVYVYVRHVRGVRDEYLANSDCEVKDNIKKISRHVLLRK